MSNESVPNLIGLAIGQGGETNGCAPCMTGALALVVLALLQARRGADGDAITASGWASVALL